MLKAGLIGLGFMGRGHLDNYIRLESEGFRSNWLPYAI